MTSNLQHHRVPAWAVALLLLVSLATSHASLGYGYGSSKSKSYSDGSGYYGSDSYYTPDRIDPTVQALDDDSVFTMFLNVMIFTFKLPFQLVGRLFNGLAVVWTEAIVPVIQAIKLAIDWIYGATADVVVGRTLTAWDILYQWIFGPLASFCVALRDYVCQLFVVLIDWIFKPLCQFLAEMGRLILTAIVAPFRFLKDYVIVPLGDLLAFIYGSVLVPLATVVRDVLWVLSKAIIDGVLFIAQLFSHVLKSIQSAVVWTWQHVVSPIFDGLDFVCRQIARGARVLVEGINKLIHTWELALRPYSIAFAEFVTSWTKFLVVVPVQAVINVVEAMLRAVCWAVGELFQFIGRSFATALEAVLQGVASVFDFLIDIVAVPFRLISTLVEALRVWVLLPCYQHVLTPLGLGLKSVFISLGSGLKAVCEPIADALKTLARWLFDGIWKITSSVLYGVWIIISAPFRAIHNFFFPEISWAYSASGERFGLGFDAPATRSGLSQCLIQSKGGQSQYRIKLQHQHDDLRANCRLFVNGTLVKTVRLQTGNNVYTVHSGVLKQGEDIAVQAVFLSELKTGPGSVPSRCVLADTGASSGPTGPAGPADDMGASFAQCMHVVDESKAESVWAFLKSV